MRLHGLIGIRRWLLLWVLYLLLAGALKPAELIFGLGAALISSVAVGIAHRQAPVRFMMIKGCLQPLSRIPGKAIRDCVLVLSNVFNRSARDHQLGRFKEIEFNPGDNSSESITRRALVVAGASVAPNSYVVHLDSKRRRLLIHEFVPGQYRSKDEEWPL